MPLSPSGCGVDGNLAVDSHNEVDARSCGCSHLLVLSAQRCHIINPGQFLTGGPPTAREGDRGAVSLQDQSPSTASSPLQRTSPEVGFRGGVYGDNIIAEKISSYVRSDPSEWSHSWAMRNPPPKKQSTMLTVKQHHCSGKKKTHRDRMTRGNNED